MSLRDWVNTDQVAPPLTSQVLEAAFNALKNQPLPRHRCDRGEHVALFMSERCAYCGERIRTLSVDENHIRLGEFW